jgi:Prokaryotic membrane lipoprotein lipid attachment site
MKRPFLALGLAAVLTACGGGGSSSDNDADETKDSIADTTSPTYTAALKVAAEVNAASAFLMATNDLLQFAGQTGDCGKGGSLNYTAPTQTATLCQRNYPNNGAYTGTYTGTESAGVISVTDINAVKVFSPDDTSQLDYTITSGNFAGKTTEVNDTTDESEINRGSVVFNAGASSAYTLTAFNTKITNNGSALTVSPITTGAMFLKVEKGSATYELTMTEAVKITGDEWPSEGKVSIAYSTTTCSPVVLTYQPASKFTLACGGHSVTKAWTDADVVAARKAAVQ